MVEWRKLLEILVANRTDSKWRHQGAFLAEDAETQAISEGGEDVQLVWELMEGVWWMDIGFAFGPALRGFTRLYPGGFPGNQR